MASYQLRIRIGEIVLAENLSRVTGDVPTATKAGALRTALVLRAAAFGLAYKGSSKRGVLMCGSVLAGRVTSDWHWNTATPSVSIVWQKEYECSKALGQQVHDVAADIVAKYCLRRQALQCLDWALYRAVKHSALATCEIKRVANADWHILHLDDAACLNAFVGRLREDAGLVVVYGQLVESTLSDSLAEVEKHASGALQSARELLASRAAIGMFSAAQVSDANDSVSRALAQLQSVQAELSRFTDVMALRQSADGLRLRSDSDNDSDDASLLDIFDGGGK